MFENREFAFGTSFWKVAAIGLLGVTACSAPSKHVGSKGASKLQPTSDFSLLPEVNPVPHRGVRIARTKLDKDASSLTFEVNGQPAFTYQFDKELAIPHIWPLRSPSGKSLLAQHPDPFPHHRSLWIVDKVQLRGGPITDYYHEWKNLRDPKQPELGHHSFIRHDKITQNSSGSRWASATAKLTWMSKQAMPVLTQYLRMDLRPLANSEYLLKLSWELRAEFGDVNFHSDWVHYAWPYLRMDPAFSGQNGGTITDDRGRQGQKATNEQYAKWVDYSNTVDGVTEGLTVFTPQDGQQRKWLTREYGTFGPRRPDARSGVPFTLKGGEILKGQVYIWVHRGGADLDRMKARYSTLNW